MKDQDLLIELEPKIEQAYLAHMESIKLTGKSEDANHSNAKRPFSPSRRLASAAGCIPDPLEYGPILREELKSHFQTFGEIFGVDIKPTLASTFFVNLLTEDNLPHYTSRLKSLAGNSEALGLFTNEWTAEEDTHGVLMRDYGLLTGLIGDHADSIIKLSDYDQGRASQLIAGTEIDPDSLQEAFAYLSLQELLTKEAHKKLGWLLPKSGQKIMNPIVGDEQNHYEFYFKLLEESLKIDPDGTIIALHKIYSLFSMPGALGIPEFDAHALTIGVSGVFDLETIAKCKSSIIRKLNLQDAEPTTAEAQKAKERLLKISTDNAIAKQKRVMEGLRDSYDIEQSDKLAPFILGKTIQFEYVGAPEFRRPIGFLSLLD